LSLPDDSLSSSTLHSLTLSRMSSRFQHVATLMSNDFNTHDPLPPTPEPERPSPKVWVDPASLPNHYHPSTMAGNVPDHVKQLNYNTYMSYGVGEPDSFGYSVGKAVRFVQVNMNRQMDRNERLEATTVAEIEVTKRKVSLS
jgi:acyl-coenzyme A thioesterase 13